MKTTKGLYPPQYSIKVSKQYFNFSAAHFMIFSDGSREPLHGHNYRVQARLWSKTLIDDMVLDFLDVKPLIRELCKKLDHKVLLPMERLDLTINCREGKNNKKQIDVVSPEGDFFSFPKQDVLFLPIANTSVEHMALYLAHELKNLLAKNFPHQFSQIEVEVEENPGQSATYLLEN